MFIVLHSASCLSCEVTQNRKDSLSFILQACFFYQKVLSVGREAECLRKAAIEDSLSWERRQGKFGLVTNTPPHAALVNCAPLLLFLWIPVNKHVLRAHNGSSYWLGARMLP